MGVAALALGKNENVFQLLPDKHMARKRRQKRNARRVQAYTRATSHRFNLVPVSAWLLTVARQSFSKYVLGFRHLAHNLRVTSHGAATANLLKGDTLALRWSRDRCHPPCAEEATPRRESERAIPYSRAKRRQQTRQCGAAS